MTEASGDAELAAAERALAAARARIATLEAERDDAQARLAALEGELERCRREQRLGDAVERVRADYLAELEAELDQLEAERPVSVRLLAAASSATQRVRERATVPAVLAATSLVLVAVRLVAIGGVDTILMWDEVGYLANARHLAGTGPEAVMTGSFYPVGASLPLVPLVWLTSSPAALHQAGVLLNIALLACLPFAHHLLLRRFGFSRRAALAGAVVSSALVSLTVQAASTWAETLLFVLFPCWLLAASALRRDGPWWAPTALSVTAVAAYSVHGRAVALLVATALLLAVLPVLGRARPGPLLAGVVAGLVALVVVRALNSALADALYTGSGDGAFGGFVDRLRLHDTGSYARVAVGQGWYALVASLGLVVPGTLVATSRVWRDRRHLRTALVVPTTGAGSVPDVPGPGAEAAAVPHAARPGTGGADEHEPARAEPEAPGVPDPLLPVALVLAAAGLAAISVGTIGTGIGRMSREVVPAVRSDLMVYGRYLEQVVVVLSAIGAAWLVDRPVRRAQLAVAGGTVLALVAGGAFVARSHPEAWFGELFNPTSSPAVFGLVELVGSFSPVRIGVLAAVAAGLVLVPRDRWVPAGLAVAVVANLALLGVLVDHYVDPLAEDTRRLNEVPTEVNRLGLDEVAILPPLQDGAFFKYQFWLERASYRLIDVDDLDPVATPYVIGPVDWDLAPDLGALLLASDPREGRALWALAPPPPG